MLRALAHQPKDGSHSLFETASVDNITRKEAASTALGQLEVLVYWYESAWAHLIKELKVLV
jgi:hypothetical protein